MMSTPFENLANIAKAEGKTQICFAFSRDRVHLHPIVGGEMFFRRYLLNVMEVIDVVCDTPENKVINDNNQMYSFIIEPTNNLTGVTLNIYERPTTAMYF
jgi:hypothetical protein